MEYIFNTDFITGQPVAKFSYGHEAFGPWLEQEIGQNPKHLNHLEALLNTHSVTQQSKTLIGKEYSIEIDHGEVEVTANVNHIEQNLPEALQHDVDDFEQNSIAHCGLEDFISMLQSWREFNHL